MAETAAASLIVFPQKMTRRLPNGYSTEMGMLHILHFIARPHKNVAWKRKEGYTKAS